MLNRVAKVFENILGVDSNKVTNTTTHENLPEWDSMKHLELVMGIEAEFGVEFLPHEVILLNSVERIISAVRKKLEK